MSDDSLTWAVEASATQIALGWIVHQWEPALDAARKPLDLQILHFSDPALGEMCAVYPILRNATDELRWLTYFKGLIDANTHPRDAGFESESRGRDGNASATTTKYNLKLILTGRLLLLERASWMKPNLRRIVAIFRVVRNSDQLGPVAKNGAPGAMKWPLMAAGSTGRCNTFRELVCWGLIEQGLSGPFIELPCDRAEFGLAM
jgi:hypothetical protein